MSTDLLGTVFHERFLIRSRIGEGGWATVYEAEDQVRKCDIALKILNPTFLARRPKEAERNIRRFLREGEILKRLKGCPHVVGYMEHGQASTGEYFLAMELLKGDQLRHYMGRGASLMDPRQAVEFGIHLCQGLLEIHAAGILHRDLAPDNVIVVRSGSGDLVPRYVDFGIGKSMTGGMDEVTQMLTIMGKPEYFSPEQARGEELSEKSDVYSLGVMLYEMVAGVVPIRMQGGIQSARDLIALQKNPPAPIEEHPGGTRIPPELRDAIMRCLHKSAAHRPPLPDLIAALRTSLPLIGDGEIFPDEGSTEVITLGSSSSMPRRPSADFMRPEFTTGYLFKGRYEIKELLGRGGMGAVYRAYDQVLSRETALKIHTEIHDSEAKDAILQEAKASASLDRCPHIVTIYDAGSHEGVPYIAMEFVDGQTLRDRIEENGAILDGEFWHIARGITEGLKFAHEQPMRVIHRDLKPSNIMISRTEVPKIADFGIAKVIGRISPDEEARTLVAPTGTSALGTAATMSPEQAENRPVDERSDIYSLGCVLYWMATGRPPFTGDPISILVQHGTRVPDPPTAVNLDFTDKTAERIILKCLEKNPEDRYQSAADLLAEIDFAMRKDSRERMPWYRSTVAMATAALLAGLTIWLSLPRPSDGPPESREFALAGLNPRVKAKDSDLYYVGSQGVGIFFSGGGLNSELRVVTVFDGSEESHEISRNASQITIPLPRNATDGARFEIVGFENGVERFRVPVAVDRTSPAIELRSAGREYEPVAGPIEVVDPDSVSIRVTDGGAGFADGHQIEFDLSDWESIGASSRGAVSVVEAEESGLYEITVKDALQNALENFPLRLAVRDPVVDSEAAGGLPSFAGRRLDLGVALRAEGFDLQNSPLPGSLALLDEDGWTSPPFEFSGGIYRLSVELPEPAEPGFRERRLTFTYNGRPLPRAGAAARSFSLLHDVSGPTLSLLMQPEGGIEERFEPHELEGRVLLLPQGTALNQVIRIHLPGHGGLPPPDEIRLVLPDREVPLAVGEDGMALLPDLPLAPDGTRFQAAVVAEDRAGNRSRLEFTVAGAPWALATARIGDSSPTSGYDGTAIRLPAGGTREIVLAAASLEGPLFARLSAGEGEPAATVRFEDEHSSVRRARIALPEIPPGAERRFVLSYHRDMAFEDPPLRREWVIVDRRPPEISVAFPELRPPEAGEEEAVLLEAPGIVIRTVDLGGLPTDQPPLPAALHEHFRVALQPGTDGVNLLLSPRDRNAPVAMAAQTVRFRDFLGNESSATIQAFRVIPPRFAITRILDVPWPDGVPLPSLLPAGEKDIRISIANRAPSPEAAIRRRFIQGPGRSPSIATGSLPGRGEATLSLPARDSGGELLIEWRDERWASPDRWCEVPIAHFRVAPDREPPSWELHMDGRRIDAGGVVRASPGAQLRLVVKDAGGLPPNPLTSRTGAPVPGSAAGSPVAGEREFLLPVPGSPEGAEWDFLATDLVDLSSRIRLSIRPVWPHPLLSAPADRENQPLPERDGIHFFGPGGVRIFASAPNRSDPQPLQVRSVPGEGSAGAASSEFQVPADGRIPVPIDGTSRHSCEVAFYSDSEEPFRVLRLEPDFEPPSLAVYDARGEAAPSGPIPLQELVVVADDRNGSGLASIEFAIGGGAWQIQANGEPRILLRPPAEVLAAAPPGGGTLHIRVVDLLGNRQETAAAAGGLSLPLIGAGNVANSAGLRLVQDSSSTIWTREDFVILSLDSFHEAVESLDVSANPQPEPPVAARAVRPELTPLRFGPEGRIGLDFTWTTHGGQRYPGGSLRIARDSAPPAIAPDQLDIPCAPGATVRLHVSDGHSGIKYVRTEIGGQRLIRNFAGEKQAVVEVLHPGGSGNYNLLCTVEDLAGNSTSRSFVLRTEAAAPRIVLAAAAWPGGWVPLPAGGSEPLEISRTEMDLGSFRAFHRATQNDEEFWAGLNQRLAQVDRRLPMRHQADGCRQLRQIVDSVVARNSAHPDHFPVRFVTDDAAAACAAYYGARLPTVEEWRAAARGSWEQAGSAQGPVFPVLEKGELTPRNARNFDLHVKRSHNTPLPVTDLRDDVTRAGVLGLAGNVREIVEIREFVYRVAGGSWRSELTDIGTIAEISRDGEDTGFRMVRKTVR